MPRTHAHRFGRQAYARCGTEREFFGAPSERNAERFVDRHDDAILPAGGQEADHARDIGAVDDLGRGPREHVGRRRPTQIGRGVLRIVVCHGKSGSEGRVSDEFRRFA